MMRQTKCTWQVNTTLAHPLPTSCSRTILLMQTWPWCLMLLLRLVLFMMLLTSCGCLLLAMLLALMSLPLIMSCVCQRTLSSILDPAKQQTKLLNEASAGVYVQTMFILVTGTSRQCLRPAINIWILQVWGVTEGWPNRVSTECTSVAMVQNNNFFQCRTKIDNLKIFQTFEH